MVLNIFSINCIFTNKFHNPKQSTANKGKIKHQELIIFPFKCSLNPLHLPGKPLNNLHFLIYCLQPPYDIGITFTLQVRKKAQDGNSPRSRTWPLAGQATEPESFIFFEIESFFF